MAKRNAQKAKAPKGLTQKQEAFALAYVKLKHASNAYREVYGQKGMTDKTVNEAASRLLADSKIKARVASFAEKVAERAGLSIERTLQEVARLSYADPRKMFRSDGSLIPIQEMDDDTAATVASVEHDSVITGSGEDAAVVRTTKLKTWDKNAALEKAMKHHGLYERDNTQRAANLALEVVLVRAKR